MKYTSSLKLKLIYIFRINDSAHIGCLKIGEATAGDDDIGGLAPNSSGLNKAAKARINSYTQTAGISYDLLYTEACIYMESGRIKAFSDSEVHKVLTRSGIERKVFDKSAKANEWFKTDLETAKKAITAVKEGRSALNSTEVSSEQNPIIFRPEQIEAIEKTKQQFKKGNEMLWFAKMRFGKTLSALQVVKEHKFKRTLILTHRPVVDAGWFEDFGKIFYDQPSYQYGSKHQGEQFDKLEQLAKQNKVQYIYFASMQDLRGSEFVGGNFDKNNEIFNTTWDFIIVDEAHEGTQTELGTNVITELQKTNTKVLQLSGTPFNLLDNYKEEEIYTWDYVMEQKAKAQWDKIHFGDPNPYSFLPRLNIFTYDLGKLLKSYIDEELAFNFSEFFRVNNEGGFIHHSDVENFLNLICKKDDESNYPYSTNKYRDNFRHTLWMIPGVKEGKALSALMQQHPVFSQFEIVNVAGDGDDDAENAEALEKVNKAIGSNPQDTYTITLSCGRLTTGVSVKPWTAVFMLAGSYNTSASGYMQTIFRVQTPATINGRVKEECFVFDFAPDRTLKVIAETAKISAKAGKTTADDREQMREFLNFCPIIASDGSKMVTYDVNSMLEQLKKVYVERVVRNGFEDNYLYNNNPLMNLGDDDLKDFDDLRKIIGSTKAIPKTKDIDINKQGFTSEEYEKLDKAEKKPKRELTDDEKRLIERKKEKKKQKESAISILRGISIRMPLMIYGAIMQNEDEELSIDNFATLVDQPSWLEFMPKGVTKQKFNAFKKYYDPDVFRAAGKRIRSMARAADNLPIEERIERITHIFGTFRNPDKETVLTPWRVVNRHIGDCMGGYIFFDEKYEKQLVIPRFVSQGKVTDEVFAPDVNVLEINSKSGLYPLYMAYTMYRNSILDSARENELSVKEQQIYWDAIVANNLFIICKTPMATAITKRTLHGFRDTRVNTHSFDDLVNQITNKPDKFVNKVKRGQTFWKANNNNHMKFNAIVGNPPYQETTEGTSDKPIYHHFYDIAFRISEKVSFITPARFLFNAGKTPKEWNNRILNDEHFKVIWYESNSNNVFSNVDIKGGVAVGFRDKNENFGKIGIFSTYSEVSSILDKVGNKNGVLSDIVYAPESYRLSKEFHRQYPDVKDKLSEGHQYDLTTNIFDRLDSFFTAENPNNGAEYIQIIGRQNNTRLFKWINKKFIDNHPNLNYYKVLLPKSNGVGKFGEKLSNPFVANKGIGHNQTFISIGSFAIKNEAISCLKYIKTKFCRLLLGTLKVTQDNKKGVWQNIPLQDFTENSDIDWSQFIPDIDQQLYSKYKLNDEEIKFIERMIKPMG